MLSHATAWDFHTPAWATNMSPILVYFKAHPRGFERGPINRTSRDIIWGLLGRRRGEEKAIGVQGLRRLDSRHLIPFFLLYPHDFEF